MLQVCLGYLPQLQRLALWKLPHGGLETPPVAIHRKMAHFTFHKYCGLHMKLPQPLLHHQHSYQLASEIFWIFFSSGQMCFPQSFGPYWDGSLNVFEFEGCLCSQDRLLSASSALGMLGHPRWLDGPTFQELCLVHPLETTDHYIQDCKTVSWKIP